MGLMTPSLPAVMRIQSLRKRNLFMMAEHPPNTGYRFDSRMAVYPKDGLSSKPGHKRKGYRYPLWDSTTGMYQHHTFAEAITLPPFDSRESHTSSS
jgi:hypothetical protein